MRILKHAGDTHDKKQEGDPSWVGQVLICRRCKVPFVLSRRDKKKVRSAGTLCDRAFHYEVDCPKCGETNYIDPW